MFCFFAPVLGVRGLWRVMDPAQRGSEGSHLSGPGVGVSGRHHLLPASWRLLGLLSISQGDVHELTLTQILKPEIINPKDVAPRNALHDLLASVWFTLPAALVPDLPFKTKTLKFKNNFSDANWNKGLESTLLPGRFTHKEFVLVFFFRSTINIAGGKITAGQES